MSVTKQVLTSTNIVPYHQIAIEIIRQQITFTVKMITWWVKLGVAVVVVSPFQALWSSLLVWTKDSLLSYMLSWDLDISLLFPVHDIHPDDGNCTVCWNTGRTSAFTAPKIWKLILHARHLFAETHRQDLWGSLLIACCTCISNFVGYSSKPETSWPVAIS